MPKKPKKKLANKAKPRKKAAPRKKQIARKNAGKPRRTAAQKAATARMIKANKANQRGPGSAKPKRRPNKGTAAKPRKAAKKTARKTARKNSGEPVAGKFFPASGFRMGKDDRGNDMLIIL